MAVYVAIRMVMGGGVQLGSIANKDVVSHVFGGRSFVRDADSPETEPSFLLDTCTQEWNCWAIGYMYV